MPRSRAAERVHVLDAHARLLERLEHRGEPARAVGHVDRQHLGHVHHHAGRLEHLLRALPVLHDEAQDPELGGVGERHGEDVDAGVAEHLAGKRSWPGRFSRNSESWRIFTGSS